MDLTYINSRNVIERYVLGQLREQEQVEFELYFLENPEILDEVELVRSLQRSLAANLDTNDIQDAKTNSKVKLSPLASLAELFRNPVVLTGNFAAIIALAMLSFFQLKETPQIGFSVKHFWVGELRGDGISMALEGSNTSVVLDIEVPRPSNYDVSLTDPDANVVLFLKDVESVNDAILVVLDTNTLKKNVYELLVLNQDGATVVKRDLLIKSQ